MATESASAKWNGSPLLAIAGLERQIVAAPAAADVHVSAARASSFGLITQTPVHECVAGP
jgi:hypothetical protein